MRDCSFAHFCFVLVWLLISTVVKLRFTRLVVSNNFMKRVFCFPVVFLLLICVLSGSAQTMDVSGRVFDPAGNVISRVEVILRNKLSGAERMTTSDEAGRFVFAVNQGPYELVVVVAGFATQKRDIESSQTDLV